jgi:signal transduction histidine kinase
VGAHLAVSKSNAQAAAYSAAIATLPSRLHESMSDYEIQRLIEILNEVKTGGDLLILGSSLRSVPLAEVLGDDRFDMASTLSLLADKRIRPTQAKLELLITKVERRQARQVKFFVYLHWLALFGAGCLVIYLSYCWWATRSKLAANIAVADQALHIAAEPITATSYVDYLQSVVNEEIAFTGFAARLECSDFAESELPADLLETIEIALEQLVRNSIEHGGRTAEQRLMAGKAEYLRIDLSFVESETDYTVVVRDDGEGIDEMTVLQRVLDLRLLPKQAISSVSKGHGIKYIFLRGYHEAKQAFGVSENSIGLYDVRSLVQSRGGRITVKNSPGSFCQFSIRFDK